MKKKLSILVFMITGLTAHAQSGLNKQQFAKYWKVESEAADCQIHFKGDTCEMIAPKGLTLWRKEKIEQLLAGFRPSCQEPLDKSHMAQRHFYTLLFATDVLLRLWRQP